MKKSILMTLFVMLSSAPNLIAQSRTGLPLELNYFMSRADVISHLKITNSYQVESGQDNVLAYVIPAPDTGTKNGLFLRFDQNKLVEIASMKSGMTKILHDSYMQELLLVSEQWKRQGVQVVYEDQSRVFYLYRDSRSYRGCPALC